MKPLSAFIIIASTITAFAVSFSVGLYLTRPQPPAPPACLLDSESTAEDMADLILQLEEQSLFDVLDHVVPVLSRRYNLDVEI